MKTVGTIKHKINQVRYRHLKRQLEAELGQEPQNCLYNAELPDHAVPASSTHRGAPAHKPLSICLYGADDPKTWRHTVCDERADEGARAKKCEMFCARRTKDEVKRDFYTDLAAMTLPEVAYQYPDMAALLWVLDASDVDIPPGQDDPSDDMPEITSEEPISLSPVVATPSATKPTDLGRSPEMRVPWYQRWLK